MALDGITTAAAVRELSVLLRDARISKIAQPENDALLFTFKSRTSGQTRLLMSASASLPLIYITEKNIPSPLTAPNFCMLLRKRIGNGRIVNVFQPSLERIIHFQIEHYDEMGDLRTSDLILELMGKYSNIILCDEQGTIIDSIKHISSFTSSVREVLPGRQYFIPDTMHKADPLTTDEETFISLVSAKPMPTSKAIYSVFTGISPVIAEEVCHRAGIESDQPAGSLTEPEQLHLAHTFVLMMEDVRDGRFAPEMVLSAEGNPVEFAAFPLSMYKDLTAEPYESISLLLQQYYDRRNKADRMRQKTADLRHIVQTAVERTARKLSLQDKQLKDTDKRDKFRIYGELLHTYGYEAKPGDSSLKAINYYSGEEVTIPLDPTMTAQENAKRYFDRYQKLKRTYEALTELISETQSDLTQLESIQTFLELAENENDLALVRDELADAGYIRRRTADKKSKIKSYPYHYISQDGYDIYVGKNNYQNDELTFKFASGGDWWFHSKGCPGSHVILKSKGTEIPDRAFEDAARLAAFYSKNRASGKVEIDYVQRKEVKKPGGAKPGFVVYYTNYSMVIDTDISALTLAE